MKSLVKDTHVHPAMARRDGSSWCLAESTRLVLWDPWGYEMSPQIRELSDLFYDMRELIESWIITDLARWEVSKGATITTRA